MRDAIAILVSSSITLPRNSIPTPNPNPTTPHHQHLSPTTTKPKSKKVSGRKRSPNSAASLLRSTVRWDTTTPSRNLQRLKDYADLASNLAEDGRFHDLLMIAESVVASGAKPSQFLALLDVNIVSAGISRMVKEGKLGSLIEVLGGLKKLVFDVMKLFDGLAFEALRQECRRRLQKCGRAEDVVSLMESLQGPISFVFLFLEKNLD